MYQPCVCVCVCVCVCCVCVYCVCVCVEYSYGDRFGSRLSTVSCKHTTHSKEQAEKRGISDRDVKGAKAEGKVSLSIHLNGGNSQEGV